MYAWRWIYYVLSNLVGISTPEYPVTLCGQLVTGVSSVFGLLLTSTLIAVIANKLELSLSESKVMGLGFMAIRVYGY